MDLRPLDWKPPSTATAAGGVAVVASGRPPAVAPPPTRVQVAAAVAQANASLQAKDVGIEFTIDSDTRSVIVRMIDRQDHTVLRQVPSPEMLAIAKALDRLQGLLLNHQA